MTTYVDTYLNGPVQADLETFASNFTNFIPSQVGPDGLFYTCVRATFDITPMVTSPLQVVTAAIATPIVGVFA